MLQRLTNLLTQPLFWAFFAFALFFSLLSPWLQPGSAVNTLTATLELGTEMRLETFSPLSEMIYRFALLLLPKAATVYGLNVLTALFGAINIYLVCMMLRFMIDFFYHETPSKSAITVAQKWATPLTAIAFLSMPDMLFACTHFQPQVFQQFFLFVAMLTTAWAIQTERELPSFIAMIVVSLTLLECKETLFVGPFLFGTLFLCFYLYVNHIRAEIVFTRFLFPAGIGFTLFFACAIWTPAGINLNAPKILLLLKGLELVRLIHVPGWILIFFFGIVPCLVAGAIFQRSNTNFRSFEMLVVYFFATFLTLFAILPTRFNPLNLLRVVPDESYSLTLMSLMALAIGFIFALTIAIRVIRTASEGGEESLPIRYFTRKMAKFIMVILPVTVVLIAIYNIVQVKPLLAEHEEQPLLATTRILDHLGDEEQWVIDNHTLMPYLLIRRYEANGALDHLHFFRYDDVQNEKAFVDPKIVARFADSIQNATCLKTLLTPEVFEDMKHYATMGGLICLRELIRQQPETINVIGTLSSSALWSDLQQEKWHGISLWDGVVYHALTPSTLPTLKPTLQLPTPPTAKELKAKRALFFTGVQPTNTALSFVRALRQHDYNNHMVAAATLALHQDAAFQALAIQHLQAAYVLNPERVDLVHDNLIHYLARYRVPVPAAFKSLIDPVLAAIEKYKDEPFTFTDEENIHHLEWLKLYVVFKPYEDFVFQIENAVARGERDIYRMMQTTTPHNINLTPQSMEVNRLTIELKTALANNDLVTAAARLQELEPLMTPEAIGYLRALYLNMSGKSDEAMVALEAFLKHDAKDLDAVSLLATLQMEKGMFDLVRMQTLPRIISIAGTENNYNVKIIQAQLCQYTNQIVEARAFFCRALELRPSATTIRDTILTLDMRLNDREAAMRHAQEYLTFDPTYPFANYILGSIALAKDDRVRAAFFLELASVKAAKPMATAYNDLAEVQRRNNNPEQALTYALKAIELQPKLNIAYETAASALIALERYDEAEKILNDVDEMSKGKLDPRIALTRAVLYSKTNRVVQARGILQGLRQALHLLDPASRKEYDTLLQSLPQE